MNWHQVIEERSYEMHQVVAEVLRREPAKLDLAVAWIEQRIADPDYSMHSKDALTEWLALIRSRGLVGVLDKLADRSEDAFRMRQSSPFAVLMPQDERMRGRRGARPAPRRSLRALPTALTGSALVPLPSTLWRIGLAFPARNP